MNPPGKSSSCPVIGTYRLVFRSPQGKEAMAGKLANAIQRFEWQVGKVVNFEPPHGQQPTTGVST